MGGGGVDKCICPKQGFFFDERLRQKLEMPRIEFFSDINDFEIYIILRLALNI
jgi:hypothetical protein